MSIFFSVIDCYFLVICCWIVWRRFNDLISFNRMKKKVLNIQLHILSCISLDLMSMTLISLKASQPQQPCSEKNSLFFWGHLSSSQKGIRLKHRHHLLTWKAYLKDSNENICFKSNHGSCCCWWCYGNNRSLRLIHVSWCQCRRKHSVKNEDWVNHIVLSLVLVNLYVPVVVS